MPSTPALLEITVRPFTPESFTASISVSGMPQRPKPPDINVMSSFNIPSNAVLASAYIFLSLIPNSLFSKLVLRGLSQLYNNKCYAAQIFKNYSAEWKT